MKNKLYLAGKPSVLDVLKRGYTVPIPEQNRHLQIANAFVAELTPLAWRMETVLANGNDDKFPRAAAKLMHIEGLDGHNFDAKYNASIDSHRQRRAADAGDIIVILPMVGQEFRGGLPYSCDRTMVLLHQRVQVIYIGSQLPPDIAHHYRHLDWASHSAAAPSDIPTLMRAHPHATLSVFDLLRAGMSERDVQFNHKYYFPAGRSEVDFGTLLAKLEKSSVALDLMETQLTHKLKSMGLQPVKWREQTAPIARLLGLEFWN